jgi:hypothetical protein
MRLEREDEHWLRLEKSQLEAKLVPPRMPPVSYL